MPEPQEAKSDESSVTQPLDYAKKYWWVAAIAMPLMLFVLTRVWPEKKDAPAPGATITNFVTVQNEILTFTGQPLGDPALKELIERALDLTTKGDYRASIPLYQQAINRAPVPSLYNNLGVAYANTGDSKEARAALRNALSKAPNYEAAVKNLADMDHSRSGPIPDCPVEILAKLDSYTHLEPREFVYTEGEPGDKEFKRWSVTFTPRVVCTTVDITPELRNTEGNITDAYIKTRVLSGKSGEYTITPKMQISFDNGEKGETQYFSWAGNAFGQISPVTIPAGAKQVSKIEMIVDSGNNTHTTLHWP